MNAFFDSSALIKLYTLEPETLGVIALVASLPPPLPLTDLQGREVRNALWLKCARGGMDDRELLEALKDFRADERNGKLEHALLDWPAVWRRTEELSTAHTRATFCRTLDILHIAIALELGAADFVSFDRRQRAVAGRAGLNVLPATILPISTTPL